ncbi:hypothetical protein ACLBWT_11075 [Paenibacillus sp. D51F]
MRLVTFAVESGFKPNQIEKKKPPEGSLQEAFGLWFQFNYA